MYHVRFLFLPKPRSSIALEMTTIRSILYKVSGISIDDAAFSRLTSDAFLPIPYAARLLQLSDIVILALYIGYVAQRQRHGTGSFIAHADAVERSGKFAEISRGYEQYRR